MPLGRITRPVSFQIRVKLEPRDINTIRNKNIFPPGKRYALFSYRGQSRQSWLQVRAGPFPHRVGRTGCGKSDVMAGRQGDEIYAALQRISNDKSVKGYVIVDKDGTPLMESTLEPGLEACQTLVPKLAAMARSAVRDLDPQNDMEVLRIRSKAHEILVTHTDEFTLIVVQDPASAQAENVL